MLSGIFWKGKGEAEREGREWGYCKSLRGIKEKPQLLFMVLNANCLGEVHSMLLCFGRYRGVVGNSCYYFGDEGKFSHLFRLDIPCPIFDGFEESRFTKKIARHGKMKQRLLEERRYDTLIERTIEDFEKHNLSNNE